MDETTTTEYTDDTELTEPATDDDWTLESEPETDDWDAPIDGADDESGDGITANTAEPAKTPETFRIKHLGQEIEVTRDEMIALAQKGRDYDRIRERADELSRRVADADEQTEVLRAVAARFGMTAEQYADETRADAMAKQLGIPLDQAKSRVRAERARRLRAVPESARETTAREASAKAFLAEYPDVDPNTIPNSVWAEVERGGSLVNAYRAHETRTLRAQVRELELERENAKLTTGSRHGAGGGLVTEEIEKQWTVDN
ncbi:MAG: hypothetical protein LBN02_04115 [Oscillospiraceae bacterium]|nr:hypothetical protein [Oscillospiraceae bacterium]